MELEIERMMAAALVLGATGLAVVLVSVVGGLVGGRLLPGREGIVGPLLQLLVLGVGVGAAVRLLNVNVAAVLAVVAIVTAGISLALDKSAQDMIAGVKLAVAGYLRVGQHVVLCGHEGQIAAMGLFTLTLVTTSREGVVIPNAAVTGEVVVNKSLFRGQAVDVYAPLRRGYERALARQVLTEVAAAVDAEYGEHIFDPSVYLRELGAMVDVWRVRVYVSDELSTSFVRDVLATRVADALEHERLALGVQPSCLCGVGAI